MTSIKTELISKRDFLKRYSILHTGKTVNDFVVSTPDGKVCAMASLDFPGYECILRRYTKQKIVDAKIQLSDSLTFLLVGTTLQQQVWKALLEIPLGKTVTYQELAQKIGKPKAYRAVANAVGANPISPLIPCHRVIRTGGALGGYYWGLDSKRKLLKKEGVEYVGTVKN
jgi:O-6-methylguanine DNA methyltransferase